MTPYEQGYDTVIKTAGLADVAKGVGSQAWKLVTSPFRLMGNIGGEGLGRINRKALKATGAADEALGSAVVTGEVGGARGKELLEKMKQVHPDLAPETTLGEFNEIAMKRNREEMLKNTARTGVLGAGAYGYKQHQEANRPWHEKLLDR